MTTTRIYYTPPGQSGTARFDVPGSNVANVALTEVMSPGYAASGVSSYHYRLTNNYYLWYVDVPPTNNSREAYANVSMRDWTPASGTATVQDYTFPGGGTLSGTVSNISITGQWLVYREKTLDGTSGDRQFEFRVTGAPGFGANGAAASSTMLRQNFPGNPNNPLWDNSPINTWQNSAIQTYSVTGNATTLLTPGANTFGGVLFYANVHNRMASTLGASATVEANVLIAFEYTYSTSYEVNLHSAAATLVDDSGIGKFSTQTNLYFEAHTETLVDYFATDYTVSGYMARVDTGGYTLDDYVGDQVVTEFLDGVLAGLAVSGTAVVEQPSELTGSAQQTASAEAALQAVTEFTGGLIGLVQQASADALTAESTVSAGNLIGIQHPGAATDLTTTVSFADTEPLLLLGFTGSLAATAAAEPQARNLIGISDGAGYITTDYAEADYFAVGTGLTIFADSSLLQVDANIIRSDGTILFEGDFATTIQPGFQISAGIVTQAASDFEISPYTTAGTGLLFAAAAELQEQATTLFTAGGVVVAAAEQLISNTQFSGTSTTVRDGASTIDLFQLSVASDSESRPSIKATIELLDGTGSLTAEAFVDQSSRAALAIDNMQVQALAGYALFGNTTNTIGINADFVTEGRIYYIDEYYMSRVQSESRLYPVLAELPSLLVDPETRVNTVVAEHTGLRVDPETRIARPELLPTQLKGARLRRIPV